MLDLKSLLTGRKPRADRDDSFLPRQLEELRPVLLGVAAELGGAWVAIRLLGVIARRGGTRILPSTLDSLLERLARSLPEEARHVADDEVARVLAWIEGEAEEERGEALPEEVLPELEVMAEAEVQSRVDVARYAIEEELDLELEYYEPTDELWPRLRATPLEVVDEAQATPTLVLAVGPRADEFEVSVDHVRWLMPVRRAPTGVVLEGDEEGARIIHFPGGEE